MGTVLLLLLLAAAIIGIYFYRRRDRPASAEDSGFVVLSRTDHPPPLNTAQRDVFWSPPSANSGIEFTQPIANPKARCYLTGTEVGSCTCKKHQPK